MLFDENKENLGLILRGRENIVFDSLLWNTSHDLCVKYWIYI